MHFAKVNLALPDRNAMKKPYQSLVARSRAAILPIRRNLTIFCVG
jgi:hypothetical protein